MGNTELRTHEPEFETQRETDMIKRLTQEADKLSCQLQLDTYGASVIRRIFVQRNQKHLIGIIRQLKDKDKVEKFLEEVHSSNLQLLDSFYEHIVKNSIEIKQEKDQVRIKSKVLSPFDREIGICGSSNVMKEKSWDPISENYVNIIDLTKGVEKINSYELYKEKGLEAIKNQQVCFIILAGGKNLRYDLKEHKECDPFLQFPSKPSLIEIFLKKFEALGKLINSLIHIYVVVNDDQRKKKIRKIKSQKIPNHEHLSIDFLSQINYGCLDQTGKLVITDENQIFMHPNGSGDLWANFEGNNYQKTGLNQFKYFQIFGVSNILEHCFDCFMIGKLATEQIPWITMAKHNREFNDNQPVIFINNDKTVHVRDPEEIGSGMDHNNLAYFPRKCPHVFLNNTVFSADFIQKSIASKKWASHRKYHCKQKRIDYRTPLSKHSSIFVFERELGDIFALTDAINEKQGTRTQGVVKGAVVLMKESQYSSPYYTKFDQVIGIVSLSQIYKKWLKIDDKTEEEKDKDYYEEHLKQICQIDPFISLEGENLEQIIQELSTQKGKIEYPLYIGSQSSEQFSNTASTLKESRFESINGFADKW